MATVTTIGRDALIEIGVLDPYESMDDMQAALVLLRFQNQLDAWAADQLTLAVQTRTTFTLTSGTSSVTLGASGATVTLTMPMSIHALSYVVPSSSPAVEVPIGLLDQSSYAAISMKSLTSGYPLQAFYQTSTTVARGTLFVWPTVSQDVTIALYTPTAIGVPATLGSTVYGPPGYAEAFMYQLALRLCAPFGVAVPPTLPEMAARAMRTMQRPNVRPGILAVDPVLTPSAGAGYNVYSDSTNVSR